MASDSGPAPKRTSDNNVDDASVPAPRKTCDDANDEKEKMIQSLKENPASALVLKEMLSCDVCKLLARGPIHYCGRIDKICSLCHTQGMVKCPVKGCTENLIIDLGNTLLTRAIHAMKLPVPCKNRKNGCSEMAEEKEVKEHEIECQFRNISPKWYSNDEHLFKNLLFKIKKEAEASDKKWRFYDEEPIYHAYRDSIEPDGHTFTIRLDNAASKSCLVAYAVVMGGDQIANKYRVELRLSSNEKEFTNTHHGPVFSIDVEEPWKHEDAYRIEKNVFASFNKGFNFFGDHNMDKDGEVTVPIMVKIIKKELDIPKEESGTPQDTDVEEK